MRCSIMARDGLMMKRVSIHKLYRIVFQVYFLKNSTSNLLFFLLVKVSDIPQYYSTTQDNFYNGGKSKNRVQRCIAPWTQTMVYPNGEIVFCNDNPDYVLGNVKDRKILRYME